MVPVTPTSATRGSGLLRKDRAPSAASGACALQHLPGALDETPPRPAAPPGARRHFLSLSSDDSLPGSPPRTPTKSHTREGQAAADIPEAPGTPKVRSEKERLRLVFGPSGEPGAPRKPSPAAARVRQVAPRKLDF
mmetsp:Transcript_88001/g.231837  ORF Transcript_88001/g.231837 Transcript_88001/m.231837 type:complete len:136 (+) Transcript_88001:67-474(+)